MSGSEESDSTGKSKNHDHQPTRVRMNPPDSSTDSRFYS
jgi:hypothetical protein